MSKTKMKNLLVVIMLKTRWCPTWIRSIT